MVSVEIRPWVELSLIFILKNYVKEKNAYLIRLLIFLKSFHKGPLYNSNWHISSIGQVELCS